MKESSVSPSQSAPPGPPSEEPPPSQRQDFGARMAQNARPTPEDIRASHSIFISFLVFASFLLPVLVPCLLSLAWRDGLLSWVAAHPASGWLALSGSALILALQFSLTRSRIFLTHFDALRDPVREMINYAWLCRFGIFLLLAVGLVFLFVPQGTESLRTLFEHRRRWDAWYFLRAGFFHFGVACFSLALWYSSRYLLDRFRPATRGTAMQTNFPRILGALGILLPALALHEASYAYLPGSYLFARAAMLFPFLALFFARPRLFPAVLFLLGMVYLAVYLPTLWIVDRGGVAGYAWHSLNRAALIQVFGAVALALLFVGRRAGLEAEAAAPPTGAMGMLRAAWDRRPGIWLFTGFLFAFLLIVVTILPGLPAALSAAGIFVFACATWISLGSALTAFSEKPPFQEKQRSRPFPVFTFMLAGLVCFGLINDNHPLRQIHSLPPTPARQPDLHSFVGEWLATGPGRCPGEDLAGRPRPLPMILVAAEGGGIRAAYWTASVLSALQDRYPCFAGRVLALSGVSGGALGSSVYAAQVAHRQADADSPPLACRDHDGSRRDSYLACSRAMLGKDFLAPTLAYFLYPDLMQRFLPFPVSFFDRAGALEKSFERAWRKTFPSNLFASPFDSLWAGGGHPWRVPALFLNGTWAENGWRMIAAPVQFSREEMAAARSVRDFSDHPIALSTAAHISARFTYVSPAGTLLRDGRIAGHVVDGGYFENSGAATAGEILYAARKHLDPVGYRYAAAGDTMDVVPVVLVIRFESRKSKWGLQLSSGMAPKPQLLLKETTVPIKTLLNTRSARGDFSLDAIAAQILRSAAMQSNPEAPRAKVIEAVLRESEAPLPLGWSLSTAAQEEMARQLGVWMRASPAVSYLDGLLERRGNAKSPP